MRCPKCGYISFDHQEACRKCTNFIGDTIAEINGTVYETFAPLFLNVSKPAGFPGRPSAFQGTGVQDLAETDSEEDFVMDKELEEAFVDDDSEGLVMDLDDFSEVSPRDAFTLDLSEGPSGLQVPPPSLDFSGLDISDLAPPVQESKEPLASQPVMEALELARAEPVAAMSETAPTQKKAPVVKSTGLEDLQVNGLDLDGPAKLAAGSAAGKRYLPSVKTGTALDTFDIDLGDLFAENKK